MRPTYGNGIRVTAAPQPSRHSCSFSFWKAVSASLCTSFPRETWKKQMRWARVSARVPGRLGPAFLSG